MATQDRLDPATRAIVDKMASTWPKVGVDVHDAVEIRRIVAEGWQPPREPVPVARVIDRTIPGPEGAPDIPVRIYRPLGSDETETLPVVVSYHGGGWVLGDLDADEISRPLANAARAVFVSVDYRLAPEARCPAPVEDAYAAYLWARANADSFGGDASRVAVAGDSAGGNLAAAVCLTAKDRGAKQPTFQLLVYPATDLTASLPSHIENAEGCCLTARDVAWFKAQYLGPDGDASHPYASPLAAPDLTGLAPAHVVVAELDPLRDEGIAYAERLAEAGVPTTYVVYPTMFHGAFAMGDVIPASAQAMTEAAQALRKGLFGQGPFGSASRS